MAMKMTVMMMMMMMLFCWVRDKLTETQFVGKDGLELAWQ
jgi:hypothetical protein